MFQTERQCAHAFFFLHSPSFCLFLGGNESFVKDVVAILFDLASIINGEPFATQLHVKVFDTHTVSDPVQMLRQKSAHHVVIQCLFGQRIFQGKSSGFHHRLAVVGGERVVFGSQSGKGHNFSVRLVAVGAIYF